MFFYSCLVNANRPSRFGGAGEEAARAAEQVVPQATIPQSQLNPRNPASVDNNFVAHCMEQGGSLQDCTGSQHLNNSNEPELPGETVNTLGNGAGSAGYRGATILPGPDARPNNNRPVPQNTNRTNNTNGQPAPQNPDGSPAATQAQTSPISQACQTLVRECDEARDEAAKQCDADSGSSTGGAVGRSSMSQIGTQISQMSQASSSAGAEMCAAMGKISAVANSAVAGVSAFCARSQSTCTDKCGELTRKLNANQCSEITTLPLEAGVLESSRTVAQQNRAECNRLSARANEFGEALNRSARDLLTQSQRCIDQQYSGGLEAFCAANPASPACASYANNDCSNPQAQINNITCVCAINSSDSRCSTNVARLNTGGGIDGSGLGGAPRISDSTGSDINFTDEASISGGPAGSGGPASKVGGRENILGLQEGGDFGPNGSGGGGYAGGDSDRAKIFRGGGGRAGGGGAWGTAGQAARQGGGYAGAAASGGIAGNQGIDLRQFLPGGAQDATRGLATAVGPDGMSGAHSNNFSKIKNRYYDQYSRRAFIAPTP